MVVRVRIDPVASDMWILGSGRLELLEKDWEVWTCGRRCVTEVVAVGGFEVWRF